MIFTFQTATKVVVPYWGAIATITLTDSNGKVTTYGYTLLPDGTAILNGVIGFDEDGVRRPSASKLPGLSTEPEFRDSDSAVGERSRRSL